MHHKLQVKFTGNKCYSSPFSVTEQTNSCASSRANEACFPTDLCPMSPETPLQQCNSHHSPPVTPSALPPPLLLVSNRCIRSKSLNAAVVVGPCCRCVGCMADVPGLGRSSVLGLSPLLLFYFIFYFRNHNVSKIFTLLPTLFDISHKGTD